MNNPRSEPPVEKTARGNRAGQIFTFSVAFFVLLLALGAIFWPASRKASLQGTVLVFDSTGDEARVETLYRPLTEYLEGLSGLDMELQVAREKAEFLQSALKGVNFIFCPDGLALQVAPQQYEALVVGRRAAPRNLRPRSVLVYRKSAGFEEKPWVSRASRTVIGDSLSLTGLGVLLAKGEGKLPDCSWGPDPYDHAPVLHAARLGAFDYACVRQWDAGRFFDDGLLSATEWGLEVLTDPVPDIILLAAKEIPGGLRLDIRSSLAAFARSDEPISPAGQDLSRGLPLVRLVGFNILLEPDFVRLRGIFKGHWPPVAD